MPVSKSPHYFPGSPFSIMHLEACTIVSIDLVTPRSWNTKETMSAFSALLASARIVCVVTHKRFAPPEDIPPPANRMVTLAGDVRREITARMEKAGGVSLVVHVPIELADQWTRDVASHVMTADIFVAGRTLTQLLRVDHSK